MHCNPTLDPRNMCDYYRLIASKNKILEKGSGVYHACMHVCMQNMHPCMCMQNPSISSTTLYPIALRKG